MWISKKKWNEMEEKVKMVDSALKKEGERLSYFSNELKSLRDAHITTKYTSFIDDNGVVRCSTEYKYCDHTIKASTSNIKDVTFEELARFVIDHEPIVREENVKVKVEYR